MLKNNHIFKQQYECSELFLIWKDQNLFKNTTASQNLQTLQCCRSKLKSATCSLQQLIEIIVLIIQRRAGTIASKLLILKILRL
ncbi:unnamed protein product [Blepharisma stoltei]|uniref:Uncharacterized protein n=1 Tax=Blepharisma stoltei TaxID=1481888 RepID=A0AAU9II17_9CILI|nr:unnamed protein product [Blepharisma stoltei]